MNGPKRWRVRRLKHNLKNGFICTYIVMCRPTSESGWEWIEMDGTYYNAQAARAAARKNYGDEFFAVARRAHIVGSRRGGTIGNWRCEARGKIRRPPWAHW